MKKLKQYQYERYAILCQLAYHNALPEGSNQMGLPSKQSLEYQHTLAPFEQRTIYDKYARMSARILWKENKKEVIVVFRGTLGVADWLSNLCFVPNKFCAGNSTHYYLHWGFKRLLYRPMHSEHKNVEDALPLHELLMRILTPLKYNGKRFTFIGHSTGGSLACVFADMFERRFPKSVKRVVTFGQPATGTLSFKRKYLLHNRTYRICCDLDIVTFMPPIPFMYWHVGRMLWLHDEMVFENTPTHIRLLLSLKSWLLRPFTYHFMKKYIRNKTLFDDH